MKPDPTEPLIEKLSFMKYLNETFETSNYNMFLCSTVSIRPSPNRGYDRLISHMANMFLCNYQTMPHYAASLLKIIKKF